MAPKLAEPGGAEAGQAAFIDPRIPGSLYVQNSDFQIFRTSDFSEIHFFEFLDAQLFGPDPRKLVFRVF